MKVGLLMIATPAAHKPSRLKPWDAKATLEQLAAQSVVRLR